MSEILTLTDWLTESNCYVIEEDGEVIIIDPNDECVLRKLIHENGWKIHAVILTHEHCDHMQGLIGIRILHDFPVIATKDCSKNLSNRWKNMSGMMETYLRFKKKNNNPYRYARIYLNPADIEFEEEYEIHWKGHDFQLTRVPGHTVGSCCIRMDEHTLFSGDYMIPGEENLTRLPGGDTDLYEQIGKPWLDQLEAGLHIYPGHGKDFILEKEE